MVLPPLRERVERLGDGVRRQTSGLELGSRIGASGSLGVDARASRGGLDGAHVDKTLGTLVHGVRIVSSVSIVLLRVKR